MNLVVETFLLRLCLDDWDAELPDDKPRRGAPLPRTRQALADAVHDKHCAAKTAYATEVSRIIGITNDLARKIRRWTTPHEGNQADTHLDIEVTIDTEHGTQTGSQRVVAQPPT